MKLDSDLNLTPTQSNLDEIEQWLIEEDKNFNTGFYCNWKIIKKAFNNDELITLNYKDIPIGFLVWSKEEIYAEIDILEIKSDYRDKGFGKKFFNQISDYLIAEGFFAIKLFCSPIESERFWKKMSFIKFPNIGYSEPDLTYFKPLVEINEPIDSNGGENKLELWDLEPYQVRNEKPKWTWSIPNDTNKFSKPIIQPCNHKWNIRWTKNGKIVREGRVEYFAKTENRIEYGPFLFIERLNE